MQQDNLQENQIEARIFYKNCPLCNSKNLSKSVTGDCSQHTLYNPKIPSKMKWMNCEDCKHQFINGYLTNEALEVIFTKTFDYLKVGYKMEEQRFVSARIIEKIMPFKPNGTWLDIGFGNGSLLFTAEEYGYEPIGVDLRKENVNILQGVGIQAYCNLVQDIEFAKPISVVSMCDVLEHIPYPKEVLISLHSKMDEDGCLLISMPNSETMIWRHLTAQNTNPFFGSIEHCHNFSKTRLESLLNECGFSIKRYGISERYLSCMEVVAQKS